MPDTDPPEQPPVLPWARGGNGAATPAHGGARGPIVTAASAIAAGLPWSGPLTSDSALRLLYLAAAASATGRLDLDCEGGRFALHFRRGVLEQVSSDVAGDALGAWLVRRGALSAEALGRAEAIRERFAGDLVSALVNVDAFRPARDLALLQEHGGDLVTRAIAADRGTAQWTPGAAAVAGFALATRWGLVCEAARRLELDAVRMLLGARARRIASRSGGRVALTDLKLVPQEARVAGLFDGRSTPAQLAAARPSDAAAILRVALLLGETELLQFGALVSEPVPPPTVTRPSGAPVPPARTVTPAPSHRTTPPPIAVVTPATPVAPAKAATPVAPPTKAAAQPPPITAAPAPAPSAAADRETLDAFHHRIAHADHFDVLGVPRTSTTVQLKAAYFQLAKRYHPDAGSPDEAPAVKKLRADIFARIGEAWGVLGNEKARADYLRELESGGRSEVDVAHIVKAEEVFRKAVVFAQGRYYPQALTTIEQAIEINPEEPEFEVWRGWLRFLLATDREAQRAASATAIEVALAKAPKCVAGHLFLARMARNTGDLDGAERYLKRGLAAVPHNDELSRELKFIELKRK